eukprot:4431021-Prymnesium_polylepis.1
MWASCGSAQRRGGVAAAAHPITSSPGESSSTRCERTHAVSSLAPRSDSRATVASPISHGRPASPRRDTDVDVLAAYPVPRHTTPPPTEPAAEPAAERATEPATLRKSSSLSSAAAAAAAKPSAASSGCPSAGCTSAGPA